MVAIKHETKHPACLGRAPEELHRLCPCEARSEKSDRHGLEVPEMRACKRGSPGWWNGHSVVGLLILITNDLED